MYEFSLNNRDSEFVEKFIEVLIEISFKYNFLIK